MIERGMAVEDVAARFGVSTTSVRQWLKLAKVASQLFEMFRDAEIILNRMMALAATDDDSAGPRFLQPYDCL
jgi:ParB family chromosome partitioning protein